MARRRRGEDAGISLFPFLSILVCVIGLLTLMIAGTTFSSVSQKPNPADVERTTEYKDLKAQIAADKERIKELDNQLSGSDFGKAQLEAYKRELAQLEEEKRVSDEAFSKQHSSQVELEKQRKLLQERIEKLEAEQKERDAAVQELDQQIADRGNPNEATVSVRAGGTGRNIDAVFVECRDNGIVLYQGEEPKHIREQDIAVDPDFLSMLDRTAADPKATVVFLLRDDGQNTYARANATADARGARNGKLPIVGHGRLDLSRVLREPKS